MIKHSRLLPYYKGLVSEFLVILRYLVCGYIPLAWRWRARGIGEVDLIVYRPGTVVLIEVKGQQGLIHVKQLDRIRKSASCFFGAFPKYSKCNVRIDFAFPNRFLFPKVIKNAWFY